MYVLMKRIIIGIWLFCLTLVSISVSPLLAQKSEVGVCGGTMFYIGELNNKHPFKLDKYEPAVGLVYRYNISPRWAIKANFLFGKVSASDALTNPYVGNIRNLSFSSRITEFSVVGELNFFQLYFSTGKNHFAPYIFTGVTVFSFDPVAKTNDGGEYHLQSLGTEGQGLDNMPKKYSLTSFALPFGIGFRFNIGKYVCIGAEWGMRMTFTDYLDDVHGLYYDNVELRRQRGALAASLADRTSELTDQNGNPLPLNQAGVQRGDPTNKDWYSFAGITLSVRFGNADRTCELKMKRKKH